MSFSYGVWWMNSILCSWIWIHSSALLAKETKIKGGNLVIALSALREIAISVPLPSSLSFVSAHLGLLDPILQCVLSISIFLYQSIYMVNISTMESIWIKLHIFMICKNRNCHLPLHWYFGQCSGRVILLCLTSSSRPLRSNLLFRALPSSSTLTYSILSLSCKCPNWGGRERERDVACNVGSRGGSVSRKPLIYR